LKILCNDTKLRTSTFIWSNSFSCSWNSWITGFLLLPLLLLSSLYL